MAEALSAPTPLYNDGSAVIQREIESSEIELENENIQQLFDLELLVEIINNKFYKKVALQFPDNLLKYSDQVAQELKIKCNQVDFFILADTSYGSCCIDSVASSHVDSDMLIHFGHCCLSGIKDFPIFYSFGKVALDTKICSNAIVELFQNEQEIDEMLIILELNIVHHLESIKQQLNQSILKQKVSIGQVPTTQNIHYKEYLDRTHLEKEYQDNKTGKINGRYFPIESIPETISNKDVNETNKVLIYIGNETIELTNLLMTMQNKVKIYRYCPIQQKVFLDGALTNRKLMKRYVQVQKAKDATTFGIVVGTLRVENYLEMIDYVQQLILQQNGKSYTFVMGKLNVAKLANFMEIDIFVLIACPENSLIDSKDFFKPVITPYELKLAILPSMQWTGDYITEFENVLDFEELEQTTNQAEDDDKPHFSLITGKFVHARIKNSHQEINSNETSLSNINNEKQLLSMNSTAAEYLNQRSFKGLEMDLGNTPVQKAEQGRAGIAKGYKNENYK